VRRPHFECGQRRSACDCSGRHSVAFQAFDLTNNMENVSYRSDVVKPQLNAQSRLPCGRRSRVLTRSGRGGGMVAGVAVHCLQWIPVNGPFNGMTLTLTVHDHLPRVHFFLRQGRLDPARQKLHHHPSSSRSSSSIEQMTHTHTHTQLSDKM
jgi:hypothetical protein